MDRLENIDITVMYNKKRYEWIVIFSEIESDGNLGNDLFTHPYHLSLRRDYGMVAYLRREEVY